MRLPAFALAILLVLPLPAAAEPSVVASIAPVHSLTARVMQGIGAPYLLLPPGASPHDHALRPSDASALSGADIVFHVSPELEPWLQRPLTTLTGNAEVVTLARTPGLTQLTHRENAVFERHDHRDDPGEGHGNEIDQHFWLDPENAKLWLTAIADTLGKADPANSALYQTNATDARAELDQLSAQLAASLAPLRDRPFIVLHDAFHYFENRFNIEAAGAVALSDARAPGPARIAAIRAHISTLGAVCLFREPQLRTQLIDTVTRGTGARIGVLDPLGAGLAPGPNLYPTLLRNIANGLADCLK